jgi:tetratricopeptide (TPR) repeat protein
MTWKPAHLALLACLLAAGLAPAPLRQPGYRDVVEEFAERPDGAIAHMLALPADTVAGGVHEATRSGNDWTLDALDRALLMHGDAAIAMTLSHHPDAGRQVALADELASAAAGRPGNAWFAHRWYKAFTARVKAAVVEAHWQRQPWYQAALAIDRGRELETIAAAAEGHPDATVYNPSPFAQAAPLFEKGLAAQLPVAALHLGRIEMLRDDVGEATRLFEIAAHDPASRVNRYLAELFLGSLFERDTIFAAAEAHYKAAVAALPRAQSGRFALAALQSRIGRDADARVAVGSGGTPPSYDPWRSYFHGTAREHAFIFWELRSEVCR